MSEHDSANVPTVGSELVMPPLQAVPGELARRERDLEEELRAAGGDAV